MEGDKKKVGGDPLAAFRPRVKIYLRLPYTNLSIVGTNSYFIHITANLITHLSMYSLPVEVMLILKPLRQA